MRENWLRRRIRCLLCACATLVRPIAAGSLAWLQRTVTSMCDCCCCTGPTHTQLIASVQCALQAHLTAAQRADGVALAALLDERFRDALLHFQWANDDNFDHVTRKVLGTALPFPLGYFVRGRRRRQVQQHLSDAELTDAVLARSVAESVCSAVSLRLGSGPFLFGERASSLDAIAFGYLAVALHAPLPDTTLRDCVQAHPNLVSFVQRVLRDYFHSDARAPPAVVVQPLDGRFVGWSVPIAVPKFRPLTKAEYRRKRADFFFVTGAIALVAGFWLTSQLAAESSASSVPSGN